MLKRSASGVLASLRGSTYRSVRLASSLVAALLDEAFEHHARPSPVVLARMSHARGCSNSGHDSSKTSGKSTTRNSEHFSPQPSVFRLSHPSRFSRMSRESRGVRTRKAGILPLLLIRWSDEAHPGRQLPPVPNELLPPGMKRGAARSG